MPDHNAPRSTARRLLSGAAPAALLLAAACSGGTEVTVDTRPAVSFVLTSAPVAEAGGSVAVAVVLATVDGPTTEEVVAEVTDLGTGSATAGSDYATFGTRTVTFPVGSESGDFEVVTLNALADTIAEGSDETVRLGFGSVDGGVARGVLTTEVSITDAHDVSLSFTSATTTTTDESSQTYTLDVQLGITNGGTLGFDVSAQVSDEGTGTATSGVDYVAFTATDIDFSAGSASGATQSVTLDVLDDGDAEGSETIALAIATTESPSAVGGTPREHTFTITDDELAPNGVFTATSGPTGTESTEANGDALDLGIAVVGTGPTIGTYVRIMNEGGAPMALDTPLLGGTDADDFLIEVDSSSSTPAGLAAPTVELDFATPFVRIARTASEAALAGPGVETLFDASALDGLEDADVARLHGVPLPGLGDVTLALERIPLPLTHDAVLVVDGNEVPGGPAAVLGDLSTWRGEVVEIPGATVFLALTSDGAEGFVELPFGESGTIHVHTERVAAGLPTENGVGAQPSTLLVHEEDLLRLGAERPPLCGGQEHVPGTTFDPVLPPLTGALGAPPTAGSVLPPDCRLALETDYQLYQQFGSTSDLTDYVTGLVAAVSDQYLTDVQTTLSIAYLGIHTTSADPWSTPETGGADTGDMLDEFRTAWNASGWPASADLAHFLSGANLGGGIAYINVLCNSSFGYGVSANLNGNINWGTWTGNPGSFTWDFVVLAHELGHNFGTSHTHDYCPPIDICYDNCNGSTTCTQGTIMSYCHVCGGMDNIDLNFHQQVANVMRQRVQSSCLGDAALQTNDWVRYHLRFNPESSAGAKSATLSFTHDAPNVASPFVLNLTGTAQ